MRTWRHDFREPNSNKEVWYDLLEDYPLIEASLTGHGKPTLTDAPSV